MAMVNDKKGEAVVGKTLVLWELGWPVFELTRRWRWQLQNLFTFQLRWQTVVNIRVTQQSCSVLKTDFAWLHVCEKRKIERWWRLKWKGRRGACKEMEKMKIPKKPKNKTNEGEEDNGKGDGDRWRRARLPTCIEFWAVDGTDHWI